MTGDRSYVRSLGPGSLPRHNAPQSLEEFYERLEALTEVLLSFDHITGYCYTQLTDVEQEQNGIYNYDRSTKFDMERIAAILGKNPEWFGKRE